MFYFLLLLSYSSKQCYRQVCEHHLRNRIERLCKLSIHWARRYPRARDRHIRCGTGEKKMRIYTKICMESWRLWTSSSQRLRSLPRVETEKGRRRCRIVDVYDGDTCTIVARFDGRLRRRRCRLAGIDAPELCGAHARPEEARASRDFLKSIISNGVLWVHYDGLDKYGRLLIRFRVSERRRGCALCPPPRRWVAEAMIESGHAVAYDGGTKKPI